MRLAHPLPKIVTTFYPYLLLFHVLLKVFGADPTWVELSEEGKEGGHILLINWGGGLGIGRGESV